MPGLMWTLISEPRIEVEGGSMSSLSGVCKIFDPSGKLVISARLSEHTCVIEPQPTPISYVENANHAIADATVPKTADLWDCRLGQFELSRHGTIEKDFNWFRFSGPTQFL